MAVERGRPFGKRDRRHRVVVGAYRKLRGSPEGTPRNRRSGDNAGGASPARDKNLESPCRQQVAPPVTGEPSKRWPAHGKEWREATTGEPESSCESPGERVTRVSGNPLRRFLPACRGKRLRPFRTALSVLALGAGTLVAGVWWNLPDAEQTRLIARSAHIHVSKRTVGEETGRAGIELKLVGNRFDYSLNTSLENVSPHFLNAVIASEDRRFREPEFSYRLAYMLGKFVQAAITCFAIRPVFEGIGCRGNSTLPQQLARNLLLGEYRSRIRKVIELIWAIKMEYGLTKDEILELYVNRLFLGSGNYGVEMAARDYFGKSAAHLTRAEAAYLAAAIKKPRWNWRQDRPGALKRGRLILELMKRGRLILELMKREGYASPRDELPGNFAPTRGQRRLHKPYLGHLWAVGAG